MEAFAERARRELLATGERDASACQSRVRPDASRAQIAQLPGPGLSNPEISTRLFINLRSV